MVRTCKFALRQIETSSVKIHNSPFLEILETCHTFLITEIIPFQNLFNGFRRIIILRKKFFKFCEIFHFFHFLHLILNGYKIFCKNSDGKLKKRGVYLLASSEAILSGTASSYIAATALHKLTTPNFLSITIATALLSITTTATFLSKAIT